MANKEDRPRVSYSLLNSSLPVLRLALPRDHVNQAIVRACERLEAAMVDEKKTYKKKVEALMSSLETVLADCLIRASPETTSIFFDFLLKHTLLLVLNGEWGENRAVKLHVVSLFRRFRVRAEKKKLARIVGEVDYLIHLMENDPWGNSALRKILEDEAVTEGELLDFVKSELGVFLSVRLEVLVHARMELQAMTLARKCLFCIATNEELFESSIEDVIYLRDFYLLILNKAKSTESIRQKIFKLVSDMGSKECVGFVRRCLSGELPFELLCKKSADVVLTMALTLALSREDTDDEILQEMIQLWFEVIRDDQFNLLRLMVSKAVCSRYVYAFAGKLIERVKLRKKEVCVEVFVRGLTLNLNEIEKCLVNDGTKVKQLKVQLSNGYLQLAEYLKKNNSLYKELLLAAFSVNPTQESFERIKSLEECSMTSNVKTKCVESNQEGKKLPHNLSDNADCGKDSPARSESDLPPPPLTPVSLQTNPNEVEGFCFFEKPPHLSPQSSLVLDSDCQSEITHSESSEKTDCGLTQQVSNLTLEEFSSVGDHNKENIPGPGKFGSGSKTLTCLQVYDADSLGIHQALCDDLSTVVHSVKHKDLCDLEWSEIVQRCEKYLQAECNSGKKVDRWPTKGERKEFCHEREKPEDGIGIAVQTPTKKSKRKRKHSKKYDECV